VTGPGVGYITAPVRNASPLTFEDLHQDYVLYCIVRRCGGDVGGIAGKGMEGLCDSYGECRRVGYMDRRLGRIV